jgi:hypothetical protein
MAKIAGFGYGSISQRYGSADPDPHHLKCDGSATLVKLKRKKKELVLQVY